MKAVLLGTTKGMGRALARQLAERGEKLFRRGRDASELERRAADLEVRGAGEVGHAVCDLLEPKGFAPALERAAEALGGFDTVVVSAAHYRAMDPRLPAWNEVRRKWDPEGRLRSAQSVRVLGDRP